MSEEIKVVITLKGNKGAIGVQSPNCDPVIQTFEGDLTLALERVPGLVEEANQRWDSTPKYPKCETPLTPQAPPASPPTRVTQRPQTAMF